MSNQSAKREARKSKEVIETDMALPLRWEDCREVPFSPKGRPGFGPYRALLDRLYPREHRECLTLTNQAVS